MIQQLPKYNDPFKKQIENIKNEIDKENIPIQDISEEQERFKKLEKETLPKMEIEIRKLIEDIKKDLLSCDPKQLLDYLGVTFSLTNSGKIMEDIDNLNNSYLDYLTSFITSLKLEDYNLDAEPSEEMVNNLKSNIEELHQQVIYYFMVTSVDKDKNPDDMRFLQSLNYFIIKGDSYPEHKIKLCKELFSKYDELLLKNYGINSEQLINELIKIANSPLSNMEIQIKYTKELKKIYEIFKNKADIAEKKGIFLNFESSDEIKDTKEILSKIESETKIKYMDSIFKINSSLLPKDLLDKISLRIGDNEIFKNGKIQYFPMNESLIYDKPLIKIDDNYFCFNSPAMQYNLDTIIENIILSLIVPNKQSKQYYKKKGDYLEDISVELFQKILPSSEAYLNLKYNVDDEVDGIVIYDNNIFIIEAKSNKFAISAKKGNTDKIKRNTSDIIEKAYQQAKRAKEYIESNEVSEFRDKRTKKVILKINKSKINNIYMINTLEPLMHITANLNSLERFGFVKGKDWIWSVYINDLRIISEIIESPTEFLLYLERRIKINDYPQIKTMEEINIFGLFLHNGLYFDDIDFPKNNYMMTVSSFSEPIDEYYLSKEGILEKKVKKPSYIKKCKTNKIVQKIENIKQDKFSTISKLLLSYDEQHQAEIERQAINILNKKRRNFSIPLVDENIGFTMIHNQYENKKDIDFYCKIIAYEQKINNWFLIMLDGLSLKNLEVNFKYFYFDNNSHEKLEDEVQELRKRRLEQTKEFQKKIGRNEICPCGSGKKYKKCCLRTM